MKLPGAKSSLSKRRVIIIAVVVATVLLLAAYAFWSVNTWNSYKTSYENWQKDLRQDVDAAIALPATNPTERMKKKTAFKDVSKEINVAQQSLCEVPNMAAWQSLISTLRERKDACAQIVAQASTFGKKMQQTITYLEHEQTIAKAFSSAIVASSGKVTEETWGSQVAIWQDAEKAVLKVPASEEPFQPIRTAAIDKMKVVQVAWAELIAAHTAKDKAKYIDAQAKLATAYEALPSLVNMSNQEFVKVSKALQSSYDELFSSYV
jgi:hypothetical protein